MVNIITGHHEIFDPAGVVMDLAAEYTQKNHIDVSLNDEGPCARALGVYELLDRFCDRNGVDRSLVTIYTRNWEERHDHYRIQIMPHHWVPFTVDAALPLSVPTKRDTAGMFGMLYGVPSWDRMCLVQYAHSLRGPNVIGHRGTTTSGQWNTYSLDSLLEFAPDWAEKVAIHFLKQPGSVEQKATTPDHMVELYHKYADFYIDVVSETYSNGNTFFVTEKTVRPIMAMTPMVVMGPQGYLSNLRARYGIKTFGDYWDESYDDLQNLDRVKAICGLMREWDQESVGYLQKAYEDMQPILKFNRERIIEVASEQK